VTRSRVGILMIVSLVCLGTAVTLRNFRPAAYARPSVNELLVTSEQDAGPGTLRDAILAADRLSARARIVVSAKSISIESALPALINAHGIDIDTTSGAGNLDAQRQMQGAVLQVMAPASTVRGLHIVHAHTTGIVVNAPGVQLDSVAVSDSKNALLLGEAASGCVIQAATFERNETALAAQGDVRDVTVLKSSFRDNSHAGFWFVGPSGKQAAADSPRAGADGSVREQVRILDSLFEKNGSGVVIANHPTLVRQSRFLGNRESAVLIMGGAARVEDSEIRETRGDAISVLSAYPVTVAHNSLLDNAGTAIMVRDSGVTIERNSLERNGYGVVSIATAKSLAPVIRDNLITATRGDAVTLIGGASTLAHNRLLKNAGAGIRTLDLVTVRDEIKATPQLDANVVEGNGINTPPTGIYKLAEASGR
jgi:hypothetical protein